MALPWSRVLSKKHTHPYIFDRKIREDEGKLPETVTLRWPFPIPPCPNGENTQEWEDVFTRSEVYLVGTNHASKRSVEDVKEVMLRVRPDVVMVELCSSREKSLINHNGKTGGEFRMAYKLANQIPCQFVLGDRNYGVTLGRLIHRTSMWERVKWFIFYGVSLRMDGVNVDEFLKNLHKKKLLKQFETEFVDLSLIFSPRRREIIRHERDKYMTNMLHELITNHTHRKHEDWKRLVGVNWQPLKIVGVVGRNHLPGMVAHWGKEIDISELSRIPERPIVKTDAERWNLPRLVRTGGMVLRRFGRG